MPRVPRFTHPIRAARSALGLTQPQLAKRLGVSPSYLKAVENGQRRPNDILRAKLAMMSGADPETLKSKKSIARDGQTGLPITQETILAWSRYRSSDVALVINIHALKDAEISLVSLGRAALEAGKIEPLMLSLQEWLTSTIVDLGLESRFMRSKAERATKWNARMKEKGDALFVNTEPGTRLTWSAAAMVQHASGKILATKMTPEALGAAFERGLQD